MPAPKFSTALTKEYSDLFNTDGRAQSLLRASRGREDFRRGASKRLPQCAQRDRRLLRQNRAGVGAIGRQTSVVTHLATALSNAAEIADTFTVPNPAGGYRGFALLRLPKSAAVFTAQSIFVQTGVPYDDTFLNNLRSGLKN